MTGPICVSGPRKHRFQHARAWLTSCLAVLVANAPSPASLAHEQPQTPTLCGGSDCNRADDFHPPGYTLVFADEFTGTELDRSRWCTRYIYGGGPKPQVPDPECQQGRDGTLDKLNDEVQRYVDFNARGEPMHVVSSGVLRLRATKTGLNERAPYEAAMIRSKRLFAPTRNESLYITARVKLPNVRGTWPAFWLNSDRRPDGTLSWPPEIDIFEGALNEIEDTRFMISMGGRIQSKGQTPSGKREVLFYAPGYNTRWNTYTASQPLRDTWIEVGAEWSFEQVCYFVHGTRVMCERYRWAYNDGTPAAPAHILLNLAIGGNWAGRHGIADEKFPTEFQVDYVRVYALQQDAM